MGWSVHWIGVVSDLADKIRGMETDQATAPQPWDQLPDHAAYLAGEPELAAAWDHELAERQAQAAKIESLLAYKTRKLEANRHQHVFTRQAVEKAVVREAAALLGLTEAAIRRLLGTAEFLTEKLPRTWQAYQSGLIDHARAAKAAQAVEDIAHRKDLLPVIDAEIAARAPGENATSVQKWVPHRVAELDTANFQQRYDRAQQKRYVAFHHLGDGMSRINALIPTLVAAQLEQQIYAQARTAPRHAPAANGSENAERLSSPERTLSQRIADAFIHRIDTGHQEAGSGAAGEGVDVSDVVSNGHTRGAPAQVKIGLLIPVETLTGASDAPAISWDRAWSLPAGTTRRIALNPNAKHDWYLVGTTQPITAEDGGVQPGAVKSRPAAPGTSISTSQELLADPTPEILTVAHPRKGPSDQQPLEEWICGTDPEEGNLLTRAYRSRTSRDRQRDAILIRDGQCTQPGCTNPGWQAEIDHTQSYETGGRTAADNLSVLCHDCHSIKSHRLNQHQWAEGADTRQSARPGGANQPEPVRVPSRRRESGPATGSPRTTPARASPTMKTSRNS